MKKAFSAHRYDPKEDEWQIIIVGVDSTEKNLIKHHIQDIIGCDDSHEHFSLMKPGKNNASA